MQKKLTISNNHKSLIPALDPVAKYYSRLSARSALYTDLGLLLDGTPEPKKSSDYHALIIRKNKLARTSTSARKKIWKELKSRYLLDQNHPLFAAFWIEWIRCESEPERGQTAYILFALNDRLVADLGMKWLFSHIRRAPSEIRVQDVLNFIDRSKDEHPEVSKWSEETVKSVARHYMASIRDFGLAKGKVRKFTVRPALYASPIRLLITALQLSGVKPLYQIRSDIFRLAGLKGVEIIEALGELNRKGALRFKMQGDVVELDLKARK